MSRVMIYCNGKFKGELVEARETVPGLWRCACGDRVDVVPNFDEFLAEAKRLFREGWRGTKGVAVA